jgi:dTDP-4-dehydrorhamnose reductase
MHRILITGSAGFLGSNLSRYFHSTGWEVTGSWHLREPDMAALSRSVNVDLATSSLQALLADVRPDLVLHCAALSGRAQCEADPARARRVNVEATRGLAEAARRQDARFVFISTDLVFDGDHAPYGEEDAVAPLSLYAETKAEAERVVRAADPDAWIIRTALMYGLGADGRPGSFLSWTLEALRRQTALHLYTNQYRMPLYAPDVARLVELLYTQDAEGGLYHAAGPDRLSRHELGLRVASAFGLSAACIAETLLPRPAPLGPVDECSLRTAKAAALGMVFTGVEEGLGLVRG